MRLFDFSSSLCYIVPIGCDNHPGTKFKFKIINSYVKNLFILSILFKLNIFLIDFFNKILKSKFNLKIKIKCKQLFN